MSPVATRLAAFTLVLAGAFGTAYAVGEKWPGHAHTGSSDGHDHAHDSNGALSTLRVPTPEMDGYTLVTDTGLVQGADGAGSVQFSITAPDGSRVVEYDEVHEASHHVMVVRPDLSELHHTHPSFAADGSFEVALPGPGRWHIVVEVVPAQTGTTVVMSTFVGTDTVPTQVPLPPPDDEVEVATDAGTLVVRRDGLNVWVTDLAGATPEGLEQYLGADAHLVAFRAGDLAYLHLHPMGDVPGLFMFQGSLPPAGTYRLFLQFSYRGEVLTVPFTQPAEVAP